VLPAPLCSPAVCFARCLSLASLMESVIMITVMDLIVDLLGPWIFPVLRLLGTHGRGFLVDLLGP
jgi:hypothetical protein